MATDTGTATRITYGSVPYAYGFDPYGYDGAYSTAPPPQQNYGYDQGQQNYPQQHISRNTVASAADAAAVSQSRRSGAVLLDCF